VEVELCEETTPFYGQPTPNRDCSGFLVGEDLILTAGHCVNGPLCENMVFVFDYAVESEVDSLGNPPPPGGTVSIPQEDIFTCVDIPEMGSPFPAGTDPDEAFSSGDGVGTPDFALVRVDREVSADRIPLAIERVTETVVGDLALSLSHPRRIPLKAEVQPISYYSGSILNAPFNILHGSSGGAVVNLQTGKAIGITTGGAMDLTPSEEPCLGLYDLCFGCVTAKAQGTLPLAIPVPPIGLQAAPVGELHHYGPPTTADDYPGLEFSLSTSLDSRPVDWSVYQEGMGPQVVEVWEGPSSGTFQPGSGTAIRIGPAEGFTHVQGLYGASMPFFDTTYGTRTPVDHWVHVGVDGFTVAPPDPFDGPDGLGVSHGAGQTYRATNRWIVPQQLTVRAEEDPEDPGVWPGWLELNGGTSPLSVTLPAKGNGPAIGLFVNGTGLDPGTYEGTIVFSSDDSGNPPFEPVREVYFDHCREVFADMTLPVRVKDLPSGQAHSQELIVAPTGGTIVRDVDMIVTLGDSFGGGGPGRPFEVWLVSPNGTEALLRPEDKPFQTVYDDETSLPPGEPMARFDGLLSPGTWTLRIVNKAPGTWTFDLNRFEVRLHHDLAPPCVP
jgi:hypothetical protein